MAIAIVQQGTGSVTSSMTMTGTFGSPTTVGNTLVAVIYTTGGRAWNATGWTQVFGSSVFIYKQTVTSSATSYTFNQSTTENGVVVMYELSGAHPYAPLWQATNVLKNSTTTWNSGGLVPTVLNEQAFIFCAASSTPTMTDPSGWAADTIASNGAIEVVPFHRNALTSDTSTVISASMTASASSSGDIVTLLIPPVPTNGPYIVQSTSGTASTSLTRAFSESASQGNLILAGIASSTNPTLGTSFTPIDNLQIGSSNYHLVSAFTVMTSTGAPPQQVSNGGSMAYSLYEIANFNAGTPINQHGTVLGAISTANPITQASPPLTPSALYTQPFIFTMNNDSKGNSTVGVAPSGWKGDSSTNYFDGLASAEFYHSNTITSDTSTAIGATVSYNNGSADSQQVGVLSLLVGPYVPVQHLTSSIADSLTTSDSVARGALLAPRSVSDTAFPPGPSYASVISADAPVLWYRLDDTGTTAVNSGTGGSAYNATFNSGVTTGVPGLITGDSDMAVSRTDNNNYIFTTPAVSATSWSFEAWVKFATANQHPFIFTNGSGNTYVEVVYNAGMSPFQFEAGGQTIETSTMIAANTVYHVVLTADSSKAYAFYVNGTLISSGTCTSAPGLTNQQLYMANVNGSVDEIAFYSSALTQAQVTAHYNAGKALGGGFSDSASRAFTGSRTASNTQTTSDAIARLMLASRVLADNGFGSGSSQYSSTVLTDSPAIYYRLGDSGATAVNIGSLGATYNGSVGTSVTEGVTGLVPGDSDTAMTFAGTAYSDGVSSITTPRIPAVEYGSNFSVEAIVNLPSVGSTDKVTVVSYGDASVLPWIIQMKASKFLFTIRTSGAAHPVSSAILTPGTYHVVGTYDGSTQCIYVNGVQYSTALAVTPTYDTTGSLFIGPAPLAANTQTGTVDEVAVYGTALTQAQVTAHYNAMTAGASGGSFADAIARRFLGSRALSDTSSLSDVLSALGAITRTVSDVLLTSDTFMAVRSMLAALADTLATSDSMANHSGINRTAADAFTTTDSVSRAAVYARLLNDVTNVLDAVARFAKYARSENDSFSTSDGVQRLVKKTASFSDTTTTSDALVRVLKGYRSESETFTTTDAVHAVQAVIRSFSELFTTIDHLGDLQHVVRFMSDVLTTVDQASAAQIIARHLQDTNVTTDSVQKLLTLVRMLDDVFSTSDAVVKVIHLLKVLSDTTHTSDALNSTKYYGRSETDTFTTSDGVGRVLSVLKHLQDTGTFSDVLNRLASLTGNLSDTFSTVDSAYRSAHINKAVTDTTTVSDIITNAANYLRNAQEDMTTEDVMTSNQAVTRHSSDTFHTSDSAERSVNMVRGLIELFTMLDVLMGVLDVAPFLVLTAALPLRASEVVALALGDDVILTLPLSTMVTTPLALSESATVALSLQASATISLPIRTQ